MELRRLGTSAKLAAILALSIGLAGCAGGDSGPISFTADRGAADQPFPTNYRAEILAFMRTYLNNPVGVRDAAIAEPVQRTIGGRLRYVACVRYSAKDSDGNYRPAREHGVVFVDGRLDRIMENAAEPCAGVSYGQFAELGNLSR